MRILPILVFIAFGANAQIAGVWQTEISGQQMTLTLNANGSGEFDGDQIKYTAKSGILSLTIIQDQNTLSYNYVLNGNSLTVSGGDLEEPITFTRAGTNVPKVSNDGSIIGAWNGNGESMEFKPDGTCLYAGHTFQYTAVGGQIKLTTQQGTTVIPYTIRGQQLVINVNGQDYTYNPGAAATAQTQNKQPVSNGQKSVPLELAGHWCVMNSTSTNSGGSFSSECLILNPDGSYIYSTERSMSVNTPDLAGGTNSQGGDRGTWWMEGDRFFYNSPTYGTGSYRLEKRNHPKNVNDPMIVLDGKAYVTTKLKAPWR